MLARFFAISLLVTYAMISASHGNAATHALTTVNSDDSLKVASLLKLSDSMVYDEPMASLDYADQAMGLAKQLDDRALIAHAAYQRASALWSKGDLSQALENLKQCLTLAAETNNDGLLAKGYLRLGTIYASIQDNTSALRYYYLALGKFREQQDWEHLTDVFNNIGHTYSQSRQLDSAEHYLQRAYWLVGETPSFRAPIILFNLGEVQYLQENYRVARDFLQRCLVIATERDDRRALIRCNQLLAEIELEIGGAVEASRWSSVSLQLAELSMVKELLEVANRTHAKVLSAQGDYEEGYRRQVMADAYRDSLQAADIKHRLSLFNFEVTERELEELRAKNALAQFRDNFQRVLIITVSLIALLAIILAYLFYRGRKLKVVANRLLELKNEQIASQAKELEGLNGFMTKLIAIISHDLKSPIQGLFGVTDVLMSKLISPEELEEVLPSVRGSLKHCNNKINDLLKWSGGTMDAQYVKKETVSLSEVIAAAINELRDDAEHKNLGLIRSNLQDLKVIADANIVQTVVRNLLHNAIKFSKRGGEVYIQGNREGGQVIVSIADNGIGMSENQLANLFRARKNAEKGTVGEKGSGIGLVICYDLVRMMGGRLWATSQKDMGSTFFVAFPMPEEVLHDQPQVATAL